MDTFTEPTPALEVPATQPMPRRARLVALLEVVLCSSIPTQLALGALLAGLGVVPMTAAGALSLPFVVAVSLADTAVLIALMVWLTRARGDSVTRLWIGTRSIAAEARFGLLLTPVVFLVVATTILSIRRFAPWLHNVASNPLERLAAQDLASAALLGVVAIVAGGLREELQRAFLLDRFERHLGGAAVGVVVLSIAFGLGHYVQGWDAAVATGLMGALWAVVYLKRRSSVGPLVSHSAFNSLEILRLLIGST